MKSLAFSLKGLRLRLGWSQSAMALYVGCDLWTFRKWEAANECPREILNGKLSMLSQAAEQNSERMSNEPIAETRLAQKNLLQINLKAA